MCGLRKAGCPRDSGNRPSSCRSEHKNPKPFVWARKVGRYLQDIIEEGTYRRRRTSETPYHLMKNLLLRQASLNRSTGLIASPFRESATALFISLKS